MGHLLQVRTVGRKYESRCAARACGFFYDAIDTDMSRVEFSEAAKKAFGVWHAAGLSKPVDVAVKRPPPPRVLGRQIA